MYVCSFKYCASVKVLKQRTQTCCLIAEWEATLAAEAPMLLIKSQQVWFSTGTRSLTIFSILVSVARLYRGLFYKALVYVMVQKAPGGRRLSTGAARVLSDGVNDRGRLLVAVTSAFGDEERILVRPEKLVREL